MCTFTFSNISGPDCKCAGGNGSDRVDLSVLCASVDQLCKEFYKTQSVTELRCVTLVLLLRRVNVKVLQKPVWRFCFLLRFIDTQTF